jgi:hypothetical protein
MAQYGQNAHQTGHGTRSPACRLIRPECTQKPLRGIPLKDAILLPPPIRFCR